MKNSTRSKVKELTTEEFLNKFGRIHPVFAYHHDNKDAVLKERTPDIDPANFTIQSAKSLNNQGAGIYVCVNDTIDGLTRKNNISRLVAVYADLDTGKEFKEDKILSDSRKKILWTWLVNNEFAPQIITVSKNGLQCYWLLEETTFNKVTHDLYKQVCNGIVTQAMLHCAVGDFLNDPARILRVPGFNHMKNPQEPFLIKAYEINQHPKYSLQELIKAFPYFDNKKMLAVIEEDKNWDKSPIGKIGIRQIVLKALSEWGHPEAEIKQDSYIYLERGKTGAFIGTIGDKDFVASASHEIPAGNRITFVSQLLGISNQESYQKICNWFDIDPQNYKIPGHKEDKNYKRPTLSEMIEDTLSYLQNPDFISISTGYPQLDEIIGGFNFGQSYLIFADSDIGKSVFAGNLLLNLLKQGKTSVYFDLENNHRYSLERLGLIYHGDNLGKTKWQQIKATKEGEPWLRALKDLPIQIWAQNDLEDRFNEAITWEIIEKVIIEEQKLGHHIIVLDHLHYFENTEKDAKNNNYLAGIAKRINDLCSQLDLMFLMLAHTNKNRDERRSRPKMNPEVPILNDVTGSGLIVRHTKNAIAFDRCDNSDDRVARENAGFRVRKTKAGPKGGFFLHFNEETLVFSNDIFAPITPTLIQKEVISDEDLPI